MPYAITECPTLIKNHEFKDKHEWKIMEPEGKAINTDFYLRKTYNKSSITYTHFNHQFIYMTDYF
jgi:hypothetical protein